MINSSLFTFIKGHINNMWFKTILDLPFIIAHFFFPPIICLSLPSDIVVLSSALFVPRADSPYLLCFRWLLIFPMSGNNTFETSDFADRRFSFRNSDGGVFSPTMFLWKKILRNMKQKIIHFFLYKESFSSS